MIHDSPVAVEQDTRQMLLFGALIWYLKNQGKIEQQAGHGDMVARAVLDAHRSAASYTKPAVDAFVEAVARYREWKDC